MWLLTFAVAFPVVVWKTLEGKKLLFKADGIIHVPVSIADASSFGGRTCGQNAIWYIPDLLGYFPSCTSRSELQLGWKHLWKQSDHEFVTQGNSWICYVCFWIWDHSQVGPRDCTDQTQERCATFVAICIPASKLGLPHGQSINRGRIFLPKEQRVPKLAGGQLNYVLFSTRKLRKMNPIWLYNMFQMGWFNHQSEKNKSHVMAWFYGCIRGFFICSYMGNYKKNIIN